VISWHLGTIVALCAFLYPEMRATGGVVFVNSISPIKLQGIWDEGFALDRHIISSIPIGEDDYGYMQYSTIRSTLGELVYQYKYKGKRECLDQIIKLAQPFVMEWLLLKGITFVLPVPPTNKDRNFQPVFEISERIAKILNAYYHKGVLIKESKIQSKDLDAAEKQKIIKSIFQIKMATKAQNILLVDDLFASGTTLKECVTRLRKDQNINKIYVLTMTKTKGEKGENIYCGSQGGKKT